MKTFLHSFKFFLVSFAIASLIFICICAIASLDRTKNQDGFSADFENAAFTLFGTKYTLSENAFDLLFSIIDFNSVFFGKNTGQTILSCLAFIPTLCFDLLQCMVNLLSEFISAGT